MKSPALAEPEILDNVFRCLDYISLWTCSLVCSMWRGIALHRLIYIDDIERREEDDRDIYSFGNKLPIELRVGPSIRELRLGGGGGTSFQPVVELNSDHVYFIVTQCPNLRTLVLSGFLLAGPNLRNAPKIRSKLDLLRLEECQVYKEDGVKYLYHLLSLFMSIDALDLDVSWVGFCGNPAPLPLSQRAGTVKHRTLSDSYKATISFITLRNLPPDWAAALSDYLARTGNPACKGEVTVWPQADVMRGLLPWPKGEQHLVNMGEFIGAASVGPRIEVLRINTMDYPTLPWLDFQPGTLEHAYLPPRSVNRLQLDRCLGVRSLLFSFESRFWDTHDDDKFDSAFQAALDIVEHNPFPMLERIFFHIDPTGEAETDRQLNHPNWEDTDELLAKNTTLLSAVIVHAAKADEAQFHHLLPMMQEMGKVEYWPTDIPWWDLEIEDNESSETSSSSCASSTTIHSY